jgi:hypothetical protein
MKIITKQIEAAFAKQGYTGDKSIEDIKVVMKLFNPAGIGTWYIYEKEDDDIYWAFVNLDDPQMAECGTVSMQELLAYRSRFGLCIERDLSFEPFSMSLAEVIEKVKSGSHV